MTYEKHTIYVLVRTDIPLHQQLVQAAHAAAEAARTHYNPEHGIASLVVLAVPHLKALTRASQKLQNLHVKHEIFFEPDWNMGNSALATRPLTDAERPLMRYWPLWKCPPTPYSPTPSLPSIPTSTLEVSQ